MSIRGNGTTLMLENMMNLHIYETGCAISKCCIINLRFNSNRRPAAITSSIYAFIIVFLFFRSFRANNFFPWPFHFPPFFFLNLSSLHVEGDTRNCLVHSNFCDFIFILEFHICFKRNWKTTIISKKIWIRRHYLSDRIYLYRLKHKSVRLEVEEI